HGPRTTYKITHTAILVHPFSSKLSQLDREMAVIIEQPVSTLASMLPTKLLIAFLVVAGTTMIIYSILPLGLADTLITLITEAEETYIEAHRMGILSAADTEMLAMCATSFALRDFLHGRTFTLLWWIREVKQFETHIKVTVSFRLHTVLQLNFGLRY
ncbi:hypothetical protein B0H14DRAFT_2772788, partial [Mycena olivaceomarginata]